MTEEERDIIQQYLDTYSDVVVRIRTALSDIDKRLNGVDPEPEPEPEFVPTPADKAFAKISSVMKNLKRQMKQYDMAIQHYRQLAKENRANEDAVKDYLKIVMNCQKAATAIDNRMAVLEEKISILKEADMTLDHIVIMNEVADNLEAVQKSMGTVEEYQATIDNLMDLDETLKDMDIQLNDAVEEDDGDLDDYMASLDKDLSTEMNALPAAPTTLPVVEKKVEIETETEERVAELE